MDVVEGGAAEAAVRPGAGGKDEVNRKGATARPRRALISAGRVGHGHVMSGAAARPVSAPEVQGDQGPAEARATTSVVERRGSARSGGYTSRG